MAGEEYLSQSLGENRIGPFNDLVLAFFSREFGRMKATKSDTPFADPSLEEARKANLAKRAQIEAELASIKAERAAREAEVTNLNSLGQQKSIEYTQLKTLVDAEERKLAEDQDIVNKQREEIARQNEVIAKGAKKKGWCG